MSNTRDQLAAQAEQLGIRPETYEECDALYLRDVPEDVDTEALDDLVARTYEHNKEAIKGVNT